MKKVRVVAVALSAIGLSVTLAVPASSAATPEKVLPVSKLKQYLPTTAEASAAVGFTGTLTDAEQYPFCTTVKKGSFCTAIWNSTDATMRPYLTEIGTYGSARVAKANLKKITRDALKNEWIVWKREGNRVVFAPKPGGNYASTVWFMQRSKKSVNGAGCSNSAAGADFEAVYQCAETLYQSLKLP